MILTAAYHRTGLVPQQQVTCSSNSPCTSQDVRSRVKSTGEIDFSNAIGGTKKVIQSFFTRPAHFSGHTLNISNM